MTPCVLVLADDPMTADLGAYLLRRDGLEVVLAESKQDALRQLSDPRFSLFVDYCQKFGPDCAEFVRLARTRFAAPIMVVAGDQNEAAIPAAYQAGVDDYLPLPTSPAVFVAKVRVWVRRSAADSDAGTRLQAGDLCLDTAGKRVYGPYGPPAHLSALETQVLHLLMLHPGQALPTAYLVERVWGCKGKENAALVKNVIYRLRRKIEIASGGAACIETAEGGGYLFRVPSSAVNLTR